MEIERYTIPRVLGVKQAAAEFDIAGHALRAWIRAGQLPVIQCGRKHLINCTVLSRLLSAGEPMPRSGSEDTKRSCRGDKVSFAKESSCEVGCGRAL